MAKASAVVVGIDVDRQEAAGRRWRQHDRGGPGHGRQLHHAMHGYAAVERQSLICGRQVER
jgi:hypothetical protein